MSEIETLKTLLTQAEQDVDSASTLLSQVRQTYEKRKERADSLRKEIIDLAMAEEKAGRNR